MKQPVSVRKAVAVEIARRFKKKPAKTYEVIQPLSNRKFMDVKNKPSYDGRVIYIVRPESNSERIIKLYRAGLLG